MQNETTKFPTFIKYDEPLLPVRKYKVSDVVCRSCHLVNSSLDKDGKCGLCAAKGKEIK